MTIGIDRPAVRALALLLALVGCCRVMAAEKDAGGGWGMEQLMEGLRQVKSAKARFVERKYLAALSKPLELSGTLLYTAPGYLEKHTLRPSPESLILTGDRLIIEKMEGGPRRSFRLQEQPVLWGFVESIRSTLAGDLKTLSRFYDVELSGRENRWRLVLRPNQQDMREVVKEIRVEGAGTWVSSVSVFETGGDRSVMTITRDAS